ncbi:MAG: hypothetical protein KA319_00925 [Ferruginibacter sp.]|nr:hypothetical protein [Ferruginibacter sp.]
MKYILLLVSILTIQQNVNAQKLVNTKWHRLVIGGKNGFYTKTHIISDSVMVENQFGSGDVFDDSPMDIKVETVFTTDNDERVVTKYGDSLYAIIVFKNINDSFADVCYYTNTFKTIEEAKQYQPTNESYFKWYTLVGYNNEMAKPVMPSMTKKDAIAFANYFADKAQKLKESFSQATGVDKTKMKLASTMILAAVPSKYAESKGYSSYKSIPVIEKGMKAFAKDADVLKIIKSAKINL